MAVKNMTQKSSQVVEKIQLKQKMAIRNTDTQDLTIKKISYTCVCKLFIKYV